MTRTPKVNRCSRCGGPIFDCNRHGEVLDAHQDAERCLSKATDRIDVLEHNVQALVNTCLALLLESSVRREAHGEICATDPCGRCMAKHALSTVRI
jgi:hypothetical protein